MTYPYRSYVPILPSGLSGRKAKHPRVEDFDSFAEELGAAKLEQLSPLAHWHYTLPATVPLGGYDFAQQAV